jgi:hypothetical protein
MMQELGPGPSERLQLHLLDSDWVRQMGAYPERIFGTVQRQQLAGWLKKARTTHRGNRMDYSRHIDPLVELRAATEVCWPGMGTGDWVVLRFSRRSAAVPHGRHELRLRAPSVDYAHKWRLSLRRVAVALWSEGRLEDQQERKVVGGRFAGGGARGASVQLAGRAGEGVDQGERTALMLAGAGKLLFHSATSSRPEV